MAFIWKFSPDEPRTYERKAYVPVIKKQEENWVAPEHQKIASSMKKDFPRDDRGLPIEGEKKRLVIDPRPTIMVPPRRIRRIYL